tara:strand:+ start:14973 stop:16922 length:1950 start_codon:yes stop_codon:yes gene_type:complete
VSNILWRPTEEEQLESQMAQFMQSISNRYNVSLTTYQELHSWACEHSEQFWDYFFSYSELIFKGSYSKVMSSDVMPGVKWFEGVEINYAENCLKFSDSHDAIINVNESGEINRSSYKELTEKVSCCVQFLRDRGIVKGDRVAAVVTNCEETMVFFLAVAAIGAVWTSVSPDFGEEAILSRFNQVSPKCLLYVDCYRYKGKTFSIQDKIQAVIQSLTSARSLVLLDRESLSTEYEDTTLYSDIFNVYSPNDIVFEAVAFNDPLYILYSSGTTGKPKSITHSVGGVLIEHIKEQRLHCNLTREDVFFYYTSCSWMMWNWLVSGLATGSTLVVFDGAPYYPDKLATWKLIDEYKITIYGTSAKYINASLKFNLPVAEELDLSSLRVILSTGSPLYEEDFDYVYQHVKSNVQLASISGGTDIVGCFALGNPMLPVVRGELQSISLGFPVKAYDEFGNSVINSEGELVCEKPVPSMPIYMWNDDDFTVYKNSYFNKYQNIWNHSDFVLVTEQGGVKILGRSDATLNRAGIRIGTAEIYRLIESQSYIQDSLVIHIDETDSMILFVLADHGVDFSTDLKHGLKHLIKEKLSPRHCPNHIFQVSAIPYTKNGKKVELAVKYIFTHQEEKINVSSLHDAKVLDQYRTIKETAFVSKV